MVISMLRRAEEQLRSGSWKALKACRRGFEQAFAYKGTDETKLARIQIVHGWRHNHLSAW